MLSLLYPLAFLQSAAAPTPVPAPAPTPAPCASEAHAAFDFWVGEWDVFVTGSEVQAGESRIERVSAGCVIRESWMPLSGGDGTSMSFIHHDTGRWNQLWVGSDGHRVDFTGGIVEGEEGATMVLTGYWDGIGPGGSDVLIRMTYSLGQDGSVRQFGEGSTDHGKTWQTSFDLTYRPKGDSPQ